MFYFDTLVSGLELTILTALGAWAIAFLLGSLIGIIRTLPSKPLVGLGNAYIELFRNIPLLVQLFIWFFVVPELLPHSMGIWIKQLHNGPFLFHANGMLYHFGSLVVALI